MLEAACDRAQTVVRNEAIYLTLGVLPDGTREILGLWIANTEGAKFWLKVFNDLRTRGVDDILIAVTDGLKGIAEALEAVFPANCAERPSNWAAITAGCARMSTSGHFASVAVVSVDQPFQSSDEAPVPLWRGHGMYVRFTGLE